jgi:hypothetical protein
VIFQTTKFFFLNGGPAVWKGEEATSNSNPTQVLPSWVSPQLLLLTKKQNKMALNFKNYQRADRTELGTIASIVGKGGSFRPATMTNWLGTQRVVLVLAKKDGTSDLVTCSTELSKRLRSKEIKLSQLMGFTIVEQLTTSGETMNCVVMPNSGATLPSVAITDEIVAYEPVNTFNVEELIAF